MATVQPGRPDPKRRQPLWDRVDRNRWRLAGYLLTFTLVASVPVGAAVLLLLAALAAAGSFDFDVGWVLIVPLAWVMAGGLLRMWAVGLAGAVAYECWALSRDERWALHRLRAELVPKGELLDTKMTIKDMAIAAGMPIAPALYLMPITNVNAFIFSSPRRRPVLGVTDGLLSRLSLTQQRAVYANLIARAVSGDTMVASAMTALVAPLHSWRTRRLVQGDDIDLLFVKSRNWAGGQAAEQQKPMLIGEALLFPLWIPAVVVGEVLAAGHRDAQLKSAAKADAEGMLLLKDPAAMRSAIEASVRYDNVVPLAGETMAELFWFWTGDSTDDDDDPQWERVARLREVCGIEGMVDDVEPRFS